MLWKHSPPGNPIFASALLARDCPLAEDIRRAAVAHFLEHCSPAEIADAMSLPLADVTMMLAMAGGYCRGIADAGGA